MYVCVPRILVSRDCMYLGRLQYIYALLYVYGKLYNLYSESYAGIQRWYLYMLVMKKNFVYFSDFVTIFIGLFCLRLTVYRYIYIYIYREYFVLLFYFQFYFSFYVVYIPFSFPQDSQ
jgi:hypothetical protein